MTQPFKPVTDGNATISASTTSANVALKARPTSGQFQLRVHNATSSVAFVRPGTGSTVAATSSDLAIPAGAVEVLTFAVTEAVYLAAILASGSGSVYVTTGDGI